MSLSRAQLLLGGLAAGLAAGLVGLLVTGPRSEAPAAAAPPAPPAAAASPAALAYVAHPVGDAVVGQPWITHVAIEDLDRDGLPDILACDAQANSIRWIRQAPRGTFTEQAVGETIMAPAHVAAADLTGDGRPELLVAALGQVFPTNDRLGSVVVLEALAGGGFRTHRILEQVARVADVRAQDLDGDGRPDLVVGHFGYDQGEVRWLRNLGGWRFESQVLGLESGAIHTPIADLNGDGRPDFAALISQEYEEIHLYENEGGGRFRKSLAWGSTNEDYGSSGLDVADLNGDGRPDFIYTNGDAFDYARPGPRPWHGIQWLENRGGGRFSFHRVGDFPGAYGPCAADLDGDGDLDLLAVSGFNDWSNPNAVSLMAWRNDGHLRFTAVPLARTPTHLITAAVGDLDGDGVPEIVTGGFHAYPPHDRMSRVLVWRRR